MAVETTTITINSGEYTQVTAASTGYSLIYNPKGSGADVLLYVGATVPAPATTAKMAISPDEAFQRTSDIDDYIWAKASTGKDIDLVITE